MKGFNSVTIAGNVAAEPQFSTLENGINVATINVGTNESYKDSNGNVHESCEWHRVVFWNKLADIVNQYVHKGSPVLVNGKLKTRKYTDQNGIEKYVTEIIANDLVMLPNGNNNGNNGNNGGNYQNNQNWNNQNNRSWNNNQNNQNNQNWNNQNSNGYSGNNSGNNYQNSRKNYRNDNLTR